MRVLRGRGRRRVGVAVSGGGGGGGTAAGEVGGGETGRGTPGGMYVRELGHEFDHEGRSGEVVVAVVAKRPPGLVGFWIRLDMGDPEESSAAGSSGAGAGGVQRSPGVSRSALGSRGGNGAGGGDGGAGNGLQVPSSTSRYSACGSSGSGGGKDGGGGGRGGACKFWADAGGSDVAGVGSSEVWIS